MSNHNASRWEAVVKAPQGGPVYVHHFEGDDPSLILREIANALDLSRADGIQISMGVVHDLNANFNDQTTPVINIDIDRYAILADRFREGGETRDEMTFMELAELLQLTNESRNYLLCTQVLCAINALLMKAKP